MHSEAEIRRAIKPLLDKYGKLNTSEIKSKLNEVLTYDEDDLIPSDTRKEYKIIQRIGNIVAHQTTVVEEYEEGFMVDKSCTPAVFIAISGIGNAKAPLTGQQITQLKNKERIFTARKVDWGKRRERNDEIGSLGEEFILDYERERVMTFDPTSTGRVLHLSKLQGDGLGYDISSINHDGSTRRIEVKTTSCDFGAPFYMSENEKVFFETYKNDGAYVYRVYDFDVSTRRGKVLIIPAADLLSNYDFNPITYAVTKKPSPNLTTPV